MAALISRHPCLQRNKPCAVNVWNCSPFLAGKLGLVSFTFNRFSLHGDANLDTGQLLTWKILNHRLHRINHVNGYVTLSRIIKLHSQIIVDFFTGNFTSPIVPYVVLIHSIKSSTNVACMAILDTIHVPRNSHLFSFNLLLCHKRIIWIDLKTLVCLICCELS